jgi:hypothetical protein
MKKWHRVVRRADRFTQYCLALCFFPNPNFDVLPIASPQCQKFGHFQHVHGHFGVSIV